MNQLIDPALLDQPDVRASLSATARKGILRPVVDYINMLYSDAMTRLATDKTDKQALSKKITASQTSHAALAKRVAALESDIIPSADPIADLPDVGVSPERETINQLLSLFRSHGWIKP